MGKAETGCFCFFYAYNLIDFVRWQVHLNHRMSETGHGTDIGVGPTAAEFQLIHYFPIQFSAVPRYTG